MTKCSKPPPHKPLQDHARLHSARHPSTVRSTGIEQEQAVIPLKTNHRLQPQNTTTGSTPPLPEQIYCVKLHRPKSQPKTSTKSTPKTKKHAQKPSAELSNAELPEHPPARIPSLPPPQTRAKFSTRSSSSSSSSSNSNSSKPPHLTSHLTTTTNNNNNTSTPPQTPRTHLPATNPAIRSSSTRQIAAAAAHHRHRHFG